MWVQEDGRGYRPATEEVTRWRAGALQRRQHGRSVAGAQSQYTALSRALCAQETLLVARCGGEMARLGYVAVPVLKPTGFTWDAIRETYRKMSRSHFARKRAQVSETSTNRMMRMHRVGPTAYQNQSQNHDYCPQDRGKECALGGAGGHLSWRY